MGTCPSQDISNPVRAHIHLQYLIISPTIVVDVSVGVDVDDNGDGGDVFDDENVIIVVQE